MNAVPQRRARQTTGESAAKVVVLAPVHILFGIAQRRRYKYVQPRVEREGLGWKIVSPNCSRNIDPSGGEIDIAWFVPANEGAWLLYARCHAHACWVLKASGLALAAALATVCEDTRREYWQ
jgi:hypothetical protein